MEFESVFKVIVAVAFSVAIPVAAYAAIAATRAIWGRGEPAGDAGEIPRLRDSVEALGARVDQLEAAERRVLELEERLDFAERMLVEQRTLPAPRVDTPPDPVGAVE